MNDKKLINIAITPGTIMVIIIFCLCLWVLYEIRDIIPIIIAALIFAASITPGVRFLSKFKIPVPISVVAIYLFVFSIFSFFLISIIPLLIDQSALFFRNLPQIIQLFKELTEGSFAEPFINQYLTSFNLDTSSIANYLKGIFNIASVGLISIFSSVVNFVLFLILTFLFASDPKGVDNFVYVLSPVKHRDYLFGLWKKSQDKISDWFKGQLVLVFVIGAITYFPLVLLDIPNALLLAVFAGFMELIPLFGPILGAIPALLMALTTGDLTTVLLVAAAFLLIQQLENNLLYPLVVNKIVGIPSVLIILSIVIGGILAGFIGVLISVPVAAILQQVYLDIRTGKFMQTK